MSLLRRTYDDHYFRAANASIFRKNDIRKMAALIKSHKNGGDLLEIGCGDGLLLGALDGSFRVCGCDLSESAIRISRRHIGSVNLRVLDIEREDIKGKYDVIVALNVLEHLNDPACALARIRYALKNDGILIFSAPNNYGIYGSIATRIMNFFDRTHISAMHREVWFRMFLENGFYILDLINGTFAGYIRNNLGKHICSTFIVVLGRSN